MEKLMYRVPEAAEVLGLGRTLVYAEMAAGRLGYVRLGELTTFEEAPAGDQRLADDAHVLVVDVQRHPPAAGGAEGGYDGHC